MTGWAGPRRYPTPTEDGDATPDVATNSRLVVVDDIGSVVEEPRVAPNPFTPNGDGINDEAVFSFDLFLLMEEAELQFEIFDLSGRRLKQFEAGDSAAGRLEFKWDGPRPARPAGSPGAVHLPLRGRLRPTPPRGSPASSPSAY